MDAAGQVGGDASPLVAEHGAEEPNAVLGGASPQNFALGSDAMRPMASLPALNRMSERMARKLRHVIEPFARSKPRVIAEPVAIRRFDSWREEQAEFTSLSLYRFRPLKGGVLIAIEPDLISALVDSFYGGTGVPQAARAKEFTGTEEQLLSRLTEALTATLIKVWSDILPVQLQLMGRETNSAFATLVEPDESVAVARFRLDSGIAEPTVIDIVYPVGSLRPIEAELSSKAFEEGGLGDGEWRQRMIAALREVKLDARSVLARPNLSWTELLKLKPGDVIPISFPSNVPLLVAGREIAVGKIGDQDGRAALKIESMSHGGE